MNYRRAKLTDAQRQKNKAELQKAINDAINTPIDRYIRMSPLSLVDVSKADGCTAPEMTLEATRERHRAVADMDWAGLAMEEHPEWFGPGVSAPSVTCL